MNTLKRKEGFSAYREISSLANKVHHQRLINVQASVFKNSYEIIDSSTQEILNAGTSQEVHEQLTNELKKEA